MKNAKRLMIVLMCMAIGILMFQTLIISLFWPSSDLRTKDIGVIIDGAYYYVIPTSGIYRYTPSDGSSLLFATVCEKELLHFGADMIYSTGRNIYAYNPYTSECKIQYVSRSQTAQIQLDTIVGHHLYFIELSDQSRYKINMNTWEGCSTNANPLAEIVLEKWSNIQLLNANLREGHYYEGNCFMTYTVWGSDNVFALIQTPQEMISIEHRYRDIEMLYGNNRSVFFTAYPVVEGSAEKTKQKLYVYDLKTKDMTELIDSEAIQECIFDEKNLYCYTPAYGGKTSCYSIAYDETGKIKEINLIDDSIHN